MRHQSSRILDIWSAQKPLRKAGKKIGGRVAGRTCCDMQFSKRKYASREPLPKKKKRVLRQQSVSSCISHAMRHQRDGASLA